MNDAPIDTNSLAMDRTEMGFGRTVMALERTLMAWIRTSLSLIGFGFTIYKFLDAMAEKGAGNMREHAPRNLGLFLILLGIGVLVMAIMQFNRAMLRIRTFSHTVPPISISMIGAIGVLLAGLFTILNIFFGVGGF